MEETPQIIVDAAQMRIVVDATLIPIVDAARETKEKAVILIPVLVDAKPHVRFLHLHHHLLLVHLALHLMIVAVIKKMLILLRKDGHFSFHF